MIKSLKKKPSASSGKIRNATPNEYDGLKFRSKLETYTYKKLKEANIITEYEKHRYILLPGFEKIRPITYLPDFVGDGFVIECKGFPNEAWPIREKLFRYYLYNNEPDTKFFIVKTQKQVDDLIKDFKIYKI